MSKYTSLLLFCLIGLFSCIDEDVVDDYVPQKIIINNPIDSIQLDDSYRIMPVYFDNIGRESSVDFIFNSSDSEVVSVDDSGLLTGEGLGIASISISAQGVEGLVSEQFDLTVSENETNTTTTREGQIMTTSSYALQGRFTLEQNGNDLILTLGNNFVTTDALPGLYIYLGNNQSSIANALEIGPITQFSGSHIYTIPDTPLFQYEFLLFWCKPFNVKVGQGTF